VYAKGKEKMGFTGERYYSGLELRKVLAWKLSVSVAVWFIPGWVGTKPSAKQDLRRYGANDETFAKAKTEL
jgi:hypothetical protein